MRARLLLAALALFPLPLAGRAAPVPAGKTAGGPPVVVQLAPLDKLLGDVRGMVRLVAGDGLVPFMDNAIKNKLGEKGWAGVDTKKPAVGYVVLPNKAIKGPEDFKDLFGFVAIPVTGEDEFKDFMTRVTPPNDPVKFQPVEGNKGLYELTNQNPSVVPVRGRFHNGYFYFGINAPEEQLDAKALVPVADLVKADDAGLLLVRIFNDRYPEELVKQQQEQMDEALDKIKGLVPPGETAWVGGLLEGYAGLMKRMTAGMKDTAESGFRLAFDEKTAEVALESYAVPKKGTALAKEFADVQPSTNRFASLVTDKSPAGVLAGASTASPDFQKLVTTLIDAGQTLKSKAPEDSQPLIDELLKGIGRTVKSGAIDFAMAVNPPDKDGHYSGVAAITFEDATGLEKAVKQAVKAGPQKAQDAFKFDVEKIGDVNVHKITPPEEANEAFKKVAVSNDIYVAFGPKGVYAAMGPDAVAAIKTAMEAKGGATKAVDVVVNPKALGGLIGAGDAGAGQMAAQVFGTDDKRVSAFSITYEGGPTMKSRVAVNLKIIPKALAATAMGRVGN